MALTVNTNTYLSAVDADAYFSTRPFATKWTAVIDATQKENALRMAAVVLDRMYIWKGVPTIMGQPMRWPRAGMYDADGLNISVSVVPQDIKSAQCELAMQWIQNDQLTPLGSSFTADDLDNAQGGIHSKRVGDLEIVYNNPEQMYLFARKAGRGSVKKAYPLVDMYVRIYVRGDADSIFRQIVQ